MNAPLPVGYYLLNFEELLSDVEARYGDLLRGEEQARLAAFRGLPLDARRLLVRMLTRQGPWFRADALDYPEIGPAEPVLELLAGAGFCDRDAALEDMVPLLLKAELAAWLGEAGLPCAKAERRESLAARLLEAPSLSGPVREALRPARLRHPELWELCLFLFFGSFEQDLSSFVLADTGRTRWEDYPLDEDRRLFRTRWDVDFLLGLRARREAFEEAAARGDRSAMAAETEAVLAVEPHPGVRQQRRYHRLLNGLGQAWERAGEAALALDCFGRGGLPPARERRARILLREGRGTEACALVLEVAEGPLDPGEERFARIFLKRFARSHAEAARWLDAHPAPGAIPEKHLVLPRREPVEQAALEAARGRGWEGFFAENHLWNALFGLAFWDVLFAPVPGAFQHRFQNGPADLGDPGFFERRRECFEARLAELRQPGVFAARVLGTADRTWGTACGFVAWRHLERGALEAAATRLPPGLIVPVLRTLAGSPRAFARGFPDLFLYRPGGPEWALWEVKGPGDTLRPEQERWLAQFRSLGAEVRVARVRWES